MNSTARLARSIALVGTALVVTVGQPATAEETWADITAQQKAQGFRVTNLLSKGKITAAQAAKFRADLDAIAAKEVKFKSDPGGGRGERAAVSRDLHALIATLDAATADAPAAGVDSSGINKRRADLDKRLTDGVAQGKIGKMELKEMRADLDSVANRESEAKQSGQRLTAGEAARLNAVLDRVDNRLNAMLRDAVNYGEKIDRRQKRILDRINGGVARGKLTGPEAKRLRAEFDRIAELEAKAKASGGAIDVSEADSLRGELRKLNAQVASQLGDEDTSRHDQDDD
jgi:hypothetical protein